MLDLTLTEDEEVSAQEFSDTVVDLIEKHFREDVNPPYVKHVLHQLYCIWYIKHNSYVLKGARLVHMDWSRPKAKMKVSKKKKK